MVTCVGLYLGAAYLVCNPHGIEIFSKRYFHLVFTAVLMKDSVIHGADLRNFL